MIHNNAAISDADVLFRPFKVRSLDLANRIVMAPMTRSMAPNGIPGQPNVDYYRRRATGGAGLILSEGTVVDRPSSRNEAGIPFFHGDEALSGWKDVIESVHGAGGRMGPQIWHVGSFPGQNGWELAANVESPSGLVAANEPRGRAMTDADIADTIAAFASAAADVKRLGFDTLEIHAAHGYLIDQFFWEATNRRTDRWGGETLGERSRFAAEIIKAVRRAVGVDFPIFFRLSQFKQQDFTVKLAHTPTEMEVWLNVLADAGVDVFHCSQRRYWEAEFPHVDGEWGLNLAGWVKKLTGKATVSVGSVGLSVDAVATFGGEDGKMTGIERLLRRMERDEFDLIAVGRSLLADPDWANKIRDGRLGDLRPFEVAQLGKLE